MEEEHKNKTEPWVLVVEDDSLINRAYNAKFEHEGVAVKMAEDGEEALKILRKEEVLPSLILLDLMLPKKNGFEVLGEIKQDSRLKDIPVLILTNLSQTEDARRGVGLGAKEYIVKSDMKIEDLIKKVKQYLSIAK
jgi:DNA-binding response OmpR family regulator